MCTQHRIVTLLSIIMYTMLRNLEVSWDISAVGQVCQLLPLLAVLAHRPLVSSGHLTLVAGLTGRTHFNRGVLKRCGCDSHLVATLHRSKTSNDSYTDAAIYPLTSTFTSFSKKQSVSTIYLHYQYSKTEDEKADLKDELYHFSVDQTMDRLPIDMCDEITSTQASFLGGAAVLNMLSTHTK